MKTRIPRLLGTALAVIAANLLIGCDNAPESAPVTLRTPVTVGTQLDDTVITSTVNSALLTEPHITGLDISVVTYNGEVQLTGFVDNRSQIALAQMIQEYLVTERIAIDSYRDIVRYLGDRDPTTSDLLKQILAVEEEHANELADLWESMPTQPV